VDVSGSDTSGDLLGSFSKSDSLTWGQGSGEETVDNSRVGTVWDRTKEASAGKTDVLTVFTSVLNVVLDIGFVAELPVSAVGTEVLTVTVFLLGMVSFWPSSDSWGEEGGGGTSGISNLTLRPRDTGSGWSLPSSM